MGVLLHAMASLELPKPGSRSQYTKCMILNLSYILYHRRKDSFVWSIFKKDPSVFNEDVCESSLSHLARAITSRPNLRVIASANKMFKRLGLFSSSGAGLYEETTVFDSSALRSSSRVTLESDEVRQTIVFLERLIYSIRNNECVEYDSRYPYIYAKEATQRNLSLQLHFKDINLNHVIVVNMQKFKKQQLVSFIRSNAEVLEFWPEAKQPPMNEGLVLQDMDSGDDSEPAESDAASETEQDSDDNNGDSDGNGNDEDQNSQLVRRVTDEANDSLGSGPRLSVQPQPQVGQVSSKRQRRSLLCLVFHRPAI